MTDPLGQSQVLPYLVGLSKEGYEFTILSFEKKARYKKLKDTIITITSAAGIKWEPMIFSTKPPVLSKFYDAIRMRMKAFSLHRENNFAMLHCRSYIAADIGLRMKKKKGTKFFFDMRAFWADEKKEGGSWDQKKWLFRKIYKHYKKKEAEFIGNADYIISLTDAGKQEIMQWACYNPAVPMSVIPCCSDMDLFSLTNAPDKIKGRQLLGLPENGLIVSYLGSIGAWYMLDEMLELFSLIKKKYPEAKFLFITHSSASLILAKLGKYQLTTADILITEASRQEVPLYTKASDINISFIQAVYSKLSSSPTKLGEVLAMGIPVIVNSGVGDVEKIINETDSGFVMKKFDADEYNLAIDAIKELVRYDPATIRAKAKAIYSLKKGIASYKRCYEEVFITQQKPK